MIAYCADKGIPPSVFLGRVVAPTDPLWTEDDQDEVLGFLREKATCCPQCGTHPDAWKNDPDAFVAELERCPGCERLGQARASVPEGELGVHAYLLPRLAIPAGDPVGGLSAPPKEMPALMSAVRAEVAHQMQRLNVELEPVS